MKIQLNHVRAPDHHTRSGIQNRILYTKHRYKIKVKIRQLCVF